MLPYTMVFSIRHKLCIRHKLLFAGKSFVDKSYFDPQKLSIASYTVCTVLMEWVMLPEVFTSQCNLSLQKVVLILCM